MTSLTMPGDGCRADGLKTDTKTMISFRNILRLLPGILLYASGNALPASAQTDDGELRVNTDAVKMIQFDFSNISQPEAKPVEAPLEKRWMQFKTDVAMPRSLLDTTTVKKPGKFIRLLPFTIWTRFDEDPIYDVLVTGRPNGLEMTWSLGKTVYKEEYGRTVMPAPGETYQLLMTRGAGITIENLDINKFLTENLTRRGRMLRRNRKHANAWKTYKDYKPTREDSLKFPTYYRTMQADTAHAAALAATDTAAASTALPQDTLKQSRQGTGKKETGGWYEYIRQKQAEESVRRRESSRKDRIRQNVYDLEKQTRRLKDLQD